MKLFILGSSGKTGIALVEQAKARGHSVTTFGRASTNDIAGNPMDADALAGAMRGHDAVLSAIGSRRLFGDRPRTDSARAVIEAMRHAGVRRLIILSSNLVDDRATWRTRIFANTLLRAHASDQRTMEPLVRASDTDWTIVRPPALTNGPLTGRAAIVESAFDEGSVSRADVAKLMLDLAESGAHKRQIVWTAA